MPDERDRDSGLSAEDEVSRVLKMILDRFQQELTTRFRRLNDLNEKFGFLLDVRILLNSRKFEAILFGSGKLLQYRYQWSRIIY